MLQQRPYTFAQTNLSPSFFACDKGADHTFRLAGDTPMRDSPLVRATCGAALGPLPPTIVPSYDNAANLDPIHSHLSHEGGVSKGTLHKNVVTRYKARPQHTGRGCHDQVARSRPASSKADQVVRCFFLSWRAAGSRRREAGRHAGLLPPWLLLQSGILPLRNSRP